MLDTLGVPVIGYRTDALPIFTVGLSEELEVPHRLDSADAISDACRRTRWARTVASERSSRPPMISSHALSTSSLSARSFSSSLARSVCISVSSNLSIIREPPMEIAIGQ